LSIRDFSFEKNPVCSHIRNYRSTVVGIMTFLKRLDGDLIRQQDWRESEKWMRGGIQEYLQVKQKSEEQGKPQLTREYFLN